MAPSDVERLQSYMRPPDTPKDSASFIDYQRTLNQNQDRATVTFINEQDYDGTFVPSTSIRTVTPPDANEQLEDVRLDAGWTPPWAVVKGV